MNLKQIYFFNLYMVVGTIYTTAYMVEAKTGVNIYKNIYAETIMVFAFYALTSYLIMHVLIYVKSGNFMKKEMI